MEISEVVLSEEQWQWVRDEADFLTYQGYDYREAYKIAEERIRRAALIDLRDS